MVQCRFGFYASLLSLLCTMAFLLGAVRGSILILSTAAVLALVCIGLEIFLIRGKTKA